MTTVEDFVYPKGYWRCNPYYQLGVFDWLGYIYIYIILSYMKKRDTLRNQICPKKGVSRIILIQGWDVSTINPTRNREGFGFLNLREDENFQYVDSGYVCQNFVRTINLPMQNNQPWAADDFHFDGKWLGPIELSKLLIVGACLTTWRFWLVYGDSQHGAILVPMKQGTVIYSWLKGKTYVAWQCCDCELFGNVKWPVQWLQRWPPTGEWKGHFEYHGMLRFVFQVILFGFSRCHHEKTTI